MDLIISLLSGFVSAFIGVAPPGLLNMTAAKISVKEGKRNALWFILGAVVVIFFQVFLAVLFARIINVRPDIVILLREVGFGIFGTLTIYFFWLAKKPKIKKPKIKKKKSKRVFLGMLLSALNFFPIPYYAFMSITLSSYSFFSFNYSSVFAFVTGAVIGSSAVFYSYISFFQKIETKTDYLTKHMNTIIGSVTGFIAFISLVNIMEYYFG